MAVPFQLLVEAAGILKPGCGLVAYRIAGPPRLDSRLTDGTCAIVSPGTSIDGAQWVAVRRGGEVVLIARADAEADEAHGIVGPVAGLARKYTFGASSVGGAP